MAIWDRLRTPPPSALKTIKGGRLAGMSDISPQWRWQAMTEEFGPCGRGWKFEIGDRWTEPGDGGEVMCFMVVRLYYRDEDTHPARNWSEPIEGLGGSKLVAAEKGGLHNNDEAWKMAFTDALGTACKYLGLAADVYLGGAASGGSKYEQRGAAQGVSVPEASEPGQPNQTDGPRRGATPPPEWTPLERWDEDAIAGSPIYPVEDMLLWRQYVYAMWDARGARYDKAAKDENDLPVYCGNCRGPCWPRKPDHKPTAPDFRCMDNECGGKWWPAKDGRVGQWYSRSDGGYPYRIPKEQP
jgi:hypothetical protein